MNDEVSIEKIVEDLETRVGYASMCQYYKNLDGYVRKHIKDEKYIGDSFKLIQLGQLVEIMKRCYYKLHQSSQS